MAREHLLALRAELVRQQLTGFVVPHTDEYQNEYLPPCAERLAWLTGFTGSAGTAIVFRDEAAIFVDGRYTLQVADQVDEKNFTLHNSGETSPDEWLSRFVRHQPIESAMIPGFIPRKISNGFRQQLNGRCATRPLCTEPYRWRLA